MDGSKKLWIRCGDQDNYNGFAGLDNAALYLSSMGVVPPLRFCNLYGIIDNHYRGHNYISIYWADQVDDPDLCLSDEEIETLNNWVKKANYERATA